MKKHSLNDILKVLKIILLILVILSLLPRIFSKGKAACAEPVPDPVPGWYLEFPDDTIDSEEGREDSISLIFDFDVYDQAYDPEEGFFSGMKSFLNVDFEKSFISSYVSNGAAFQAGLQDGTITQDQFLSLSKMYEICWVHLVLKAGFLAFIFIALFKAVRSFF